MTEIAIALGELRAYLRWLGRRGGDPEANHEEADDLLLRYIDDPGVTEAFRAIKKWYA